MRENLQESRPRRGRPAVLALLAVALLAGCAAHGPVPPVDPAPVEADAPEPPLPTAEEIRRLARIHAGLDPDGEGAIPPADRWIGRRYEPASRPGEANVNIRVNQDTSGRDQNETVITVNPQDPLNLIGGANDYRTGSVKCGYYSTLDGGLTWTDGVLTETTYPLQGDPTVAFCGDGTAVYVCLSFTGSFQPHGLFAYLTGDGGQSWDGPHVILNRGTGFPFADKEWVACDATDGPYSDRSYVTWTDFGSGQTPILLRWSRSGRRWSDSVRVSDGNSTQGSVIAIGPDSSVNVAWLDTAGQQVGFDRSTDGGRTFGADVFPSDVQAIPNDPVFRRNSFPVMDADRSAGPHSGNLYIVWADRRFGDPDILLVRSTDGGQTWSLPLRVNDDPLGNGADQWFPWISVDPEGRVVVVFFDRRRFAGQRLYETWGAISRDGGVTFDTNFLISEVESDGFLNTFIGDYNGLATTADTLYPLWTDLRAGTGETDVYTDRFPNVFHYDEVTNLRFLDEDTLQFDALDVRFGQDLEYDVASGLLGELSADRGYARAACAADEWPAPPYVDTRIPPPGDGYWFLIRASGIDGVGTWGDGTPARPNVRDALDEASPCP